RNVTGVQTCALPISIIHSNNILKTLISGIINIIIVLYIATWFAPYFTQLASNSDKTDITGQTTSLWNGNVFDIIIANISRLEYLGLIMLIIITIPIGIFVKRKVNKDFPSSNESE